LYEADSRLKSAEQVSAPVMEFLVARLASRRQNNLSDEMKTPESVFPDGLRGLKSPEENAGNMSCSFLPASGSKATTSNLRVFGT